MRALLLTFVLVSCAAPASAPATTPATTTPSTPHRRVADIAREELDRAVAKWKPKSAVLVVLDPATGAVLAAEGRDGARDEPALATTKTYVTGSTLKTLVIAAAIEEKTIAPDVSFDCKDRAYAKGTLTDASPHGTLTISEVLAVSSNVGASRVYDTLGLERLYGWLRRFHLDDPPSKLPVVTNGEGIEAAMLASGELAEATPMQMAAAYAAIVNGGVWAAKGSSQRVLRSETAKTMLAMLEGAVTSDMGTGKLARIEGHRVAGKTGTGDHHGAYYASFAGTVLDAKTPFVVLVGLELPQSSGYTGASAAAPTFARVARRIMEGER